MHVKPVVIIVALLLFLSFSSCLPGDGSDTEADPAGFFRGIWHGWIAPFSLIISAVNEKIALYEHHNIGFLYDLGFYLAVLGGFGGFRLIRRKQSDS